jgi:hypothetical protein
VNLVGSHKSNSIALPLPPIDCIPKLYTTLQSLQYLQTLQVLQSLQVADVRDYVAPNNYYLESSQVAVRYLSGNRQ